MSFTATDFQSVMPQHSNLSLEIPTSSSSSSSSVSSNSSSSSSSSSVSSLLVQSALLNSSKEITGLSKKSIETFVQTSQLFEYVRDKKGATERLDAVANKAETPKKLLQLIEMLNRGPMDTKGALFKDADLEDLTVLAHLSGKITDGQLGTVFYWKSAYKLNGNKKGTVKEVPLFLKDGKINPIARQMMLQTVSPPGEDSLNYPILTKEEVEKWFEAMRSLPASEQRFLVGKDPEEPTIMDVLYNGVQFNLFNQLQCKDDTYRFYPSTGMVKTLFGIPKGSQNIKLVYRFGAGRTLRNNGLRGERDITLRNPYQLTPKKADYFAAPGAEYTSHDLVYHAYIVNFVPLEEQRLFIELGDIFAKEATNNHDLNYYIADRFYDMECALYRPELANKLPNDVTRFAATAFTQITQANDRQRLAELDAFIGTPSEKEELQQKRILEQNPDKNSNIRTAGRMKIAHYLRSKDNPTDFELQVAKEITSDRFDREENLLNKIETESLEMLREEAAN